VLERTVFLSNLFLTKGEPVFIAVFQQIYADIANN